MSRFTSFLSAAFTKIVQSDGTELPRRKKVNFVGCTIADNPTEERTDITPPGVGGGETNTNSNAGTGVGQLVKTKVGVDTPIKTLAKASGDMIAIANGTNEVTFSLPNMSIGTGDPDGVKSASQGDVFIRTDVQAIYQNTDGATAWSVTTGGVESVFGRTGVVTAAASDYDASQVDNDSNVSGTTVADALNNLAQTNLAIWSPGVTDAPPIYGTLAAALTAVKAQVGPGAILMHPTTASAFATVASTTYDFDSRVSLYSINNRTLTFGDSAPIINVPEVGCLQDGFEIDVDDGASATGTRLLEVSSNTLRPHIFNLTKAGTSRRLVQFTGGTAAAERGIIIGRNVTTAMAGDIYSDGKTAVTLRGHGHSFVAGVVENSSAHGEDLEVILEDAQGVTESDLVAGWGTGSNSVTYKVHAFRQTGRVLGQVTSTATGSGTGGEGTFSKIANTTASGFLTGGVTTGGVSNRLVIPSTGTGTYRLTGSATFEPTDGTGIDKTRHIRFAVSGTGVANSERSAQLNSATGFHESISTEIIHSLIGTQYVELEYTGPDSAAGVSITRMSLSVERIA